MYSIRNLVAASIMLAASPLNARTATTQSDSVVDRPNILAIVIDDASWDQFSTNLQNISTFAQDSRVYTRFYTSTVCSPTRYQLNFGRYPHRASIGAAINDCNKKGAQLEEISIAEALRDAGYATGLFGKWHLSGENPPIDLTMAGQSHGYEDWYAGRVGNIKEQLNDCTQSLGPAGQTHAADNWLRLDNGIESWSTKYSSEAIADSWQRWWQGETERPKFAMLNFLAAHSPFTLPPEHLIGGPWTGPNTSRGHYEASIIAIDTLLGEMFASIDFTNTYVFLLSDNGTPDTILSAPVIQNFYKGYKGTQYEGGINVPLIVRGPTIAPGFDASLVQACDLPLTILNLCDVQPTSGFDDSIAFDESFSGQVESAREFAFSHRFIIKTGLSGQPVLDQNEWAIIRKDGFKLLQETKTSPKELYHLIYLGEQGDPLGCTEVGSGCLGVAEELEALYQQALGDDWPF